jgi:hypothetical protein
MTIGFDVGTGNFGLVAVLFLVEAGIEAFFLTISCEYTLPEPRERNNDNKTILNKFVCNGINAIFVKLWPVF